MRRSVRVISVLSALLVIGIATAAFFLSFEAIRQLATDNGVPVQQAWLLPLIVEGAIVVFGFDVLRGSLLGADMRWSRALVVAFAVVSIVFNVGHNHSTGFGVFIAMLPPIALLVAFETLMSQIKQAVAIGGRKGEKEWQAEIKAAQAEAERLKKEVEARQVEAKAVQEQLAQAQAETKAAQEELAQVKAEAKTTQGRLKTAQATIESSQVAVNAWPHMGQYGQLLLRGLIGEVDAAQIASKVEPSLSTVKRDLAKLNGGGR